MIIQIDGVLSPEAVAQLASALAAEQDSFKSGAATAGWHARTVKNNEQSSGAAAKSAKEQVEQALLANAVFKSVARPKRLVGLLVSRYRAGMEYGLHIDNAMMQGIRTDLSFTVFLSSPETYWGGELVIEGHDGENAIKLPAGSAVVYPTTSLHRVAPITWGERLVVVGWVRSLIRRGDQREALFDLDQMVQDLRENGGSKDQLNRILKIRANLQRMWVED